MNHRNMKYRTIIFFFPIVLLFLVCCKDSTKTSQLPGKKKIVLKVAHNGTENHPFQVGFEKFKQVLADETEGSVEVQIFPNAQLGSEEETSQMVKLGLIAASASSTAGGLSTSVPQAELFNLPFIFRDLDHCYKVLDGPTGQWLADIVEDKLNCVVLGYWFSGIRNVWNA